MAQNQVSQLYAGINPNLYQSKWVWIQAHDINSRAYQNVSLLFLENSVFSFKNMQILDWKQKAKYLFQVAPMWFTMSQFI